MEFRNIILILGLQIYRVSMLFVDMYISTKQDKYLQNTLLMSTSSVSLIDCAVACQSFQQCQSFGFEPRTKSCHLHGQSSDSVPSDLITQKGWIHGNGDHWSKTFMGPCADHSCPAGQKCQVDSITRAPICVTDTLCPVPPEVTNAVLSPGGQEIGASRTYTCQDEYLDTESFLTSAVTTCLPDNTWAPVNLTCSGPYVKREIKSDPSYIFHNIESDVLSRLTGTTSSLIFLVKACTDSNFLIHEDLDYNTGGLYEIVIGGYRNTKSLIVKGLQGVQKDVHSEAGLLSCSQLRPFWLSWSDNIITVGKGNTVGNQELLQWSPDPPLEYNFVSYSSHIKNAAIWYFLVQE